MQSQTAYFLLCKACQFCCTIFPNIYYFTDEPCNRYMFTFNTVLKAFPVQASHNQLHNKQTAAAVGVLCYHLYSLVLLQSIWDYYKVQIEYLDVLMFFNNLITRTTIQPWLVCVFWAPVLNGVINMC